MKAVAVRGTTSTDRRRGQRVTAERFIDELVRKTVAAAPPFSDEQREILRRLATQPAATVTSLPRRSDSATQRAA